MVNYKNKLKYNEQVSKKVHSNILSLGGVVSDICFCGVIVVKVDNHIGYIILRAEQH